MTSTEYTIQELTQISGVPRRNIYFYTQQGILPPPQGAGLGARYSDTHLLRLKAIPVLRSQGLRLDQIRERLQGLDDEAIDRLAQPAPARSYLMEASFPAPHPPAALTYTHYALPGGATLVVPANAPADERLKIDRLIQAAQVIWNQPVEADGESNHREPNPPADEPDERN